MRDEILPVLGQQQSFICSAGCGECQAVEFDHVYSETRDRVTDEVIEKKTHKAYKSSCCGSDVEIWDEGIQSTVPWPRFYPAAPDCKQCAGTGYATVAGHAGGRCGCTTNGIKVR